MVAAMFAELATIVVLVGTLLSAAAGSAVGFFWDGTSLTIIGGLTLAGVGSALVFGIIKLVQRLIKSIVRA